MNNQQPFDSFPFMQQMTDQFRKMFGDDFVRNLMNSMQMQNWWGPGGPTAGMNPMGEGMGGRSAGEGFRPAQNGAPDFAQTQSTQNWNPFAAVPPEGSGDFPRADVYQTRHEVILVVEVPGLARASDIKLSVYPDRIVIKGELRRKTFSSESAELSSTERFNGPFERTIALPTRVRKQHAKAVYHAGLLEVRMMKEGKSDIDSQVVDVDFT